MKQIAYVNNTEIVALQPGKQIKAALQLTRDTNEQVEKFLNITHLQWRERTWKVTLIERNGLTVTLTAIY